MVYKKLNSHKSGGAALRTFFLALRPGPLGIPREGVLLGVDADRGRGVLVHLEVEDLARGTKHLGNAEGDRVSLVQSHEKVSWLVEVFEMKKG